MTDKSLKIEDVLNDLFFAIPIELLYDGFPVQCLYLGSIFVSQSFAFYMDESGSPKPNPKDSASYFAVGGVLIEHNDESSICLQIADLKKRWGIDESVPLHGNEIRSRKKNFAGSSLLFMLNQQTRCQDNILLTQKFRKFLKP